MRRNLCLIFAAFLFFAATNAAQDNQSVEPFKLREGVSFSASKKSPIPPAAQTNNSKTVEITADYEEAIRLIEENYVSGNKLDTASLTKSSITAMLRTLDPHSNFFDSREYGELLTDHKSEYIGIGCSIASYKTNGISETFFTSTYPDSPAFKAGLRFGDKIVSIDGEPISGKNVYEVRDKIRGANNSTVEIVVEKAATGKLDTVSLKRKFVSNPSIPDAYILQPGIGYIELSNGFNYTAAAELEKSLENLTTQGMNSLILDLRNNPGGIVEQAVRVAEKFLKPGQVVVTQKGRTPIDNRIWKSRISGIENIPLVILVNENTASASEIVAGALQDYDRAVIVGEKTFGKGLVQSIFDLPDGTGLTLTTAGYFTPSGRSIQRDYLHIGNYDYFKHKIPQTPVSAGFGRTTTGRIVYGGDGITPDEFVKDKIPSAGQIKLLDSIFLFSRELVSGRIKGLEDFKITAPVFGHRIRKIDFPDDGKLFSAYSDYLRENKIKENMSETEREFIVVRIRFNIASAKFGNAAANQVLIEKDLQVAAAANLLPRARNLYAAARKSSAKSIRSEKPVISSIKTSLKSQVNSKQ